jgi:hypothetical protein
MGICTQAPLFDPLTNLKAARLLYEVAGWSPWSICHRDKHANRSPVTRPVLVNYWRFINCATTVRYIPKHINKGKTK